MNNEEILLECIRQHKLSDLDWQVEAWEFYKKFGFIALIKTYPEIKMPCGLVHKAVIAYIGN